MLSNPNAILATRLRNAIKKANPDIELEFGLRNINRTGLPCGCTGYIHDPVTGNTVFVNTEPSCVGLGYLVRSTQGKERAGCYGLDGEGANYHEKSLEAIVGRVHALLRIPHFIRDWRKYQVWANEQYEGRNAA